jgi:hypothetical protein
MILVLPVALRTSGTRAIDFKAPDIKNVRFPGKKFCQIQTVAGANLK